MANDPQSGKRQRRARMPRRHPRRPSGFGMWVLVAMACIPAVGTLSYNVGIFFWLPAAIFIAGILVHYVRLAVLRRSLARTIVSGGCLLPLLVLGCILLMEPVVRIEPGLLFGLMCASFPLAFIGGLAGFLTAVLIEAARLVWEGTWIWILPRKRCRRREDAAPSSTRRLDDNTLPMEMPPSRFCRAASASAGCWYW